MSVKLKIKGKEYTVNEAKELYEELHELFGQKEYIPPPIYPWIEPYKPAPNPWEPAPTYPGVGPFIYTTSDTENVPYYTC